MTGRLLLVLLIVMMGRSVSAAESRTLLFVDDHDVLYRSGTRRFLNPAVRHAKNPLIAEDKPWELAIGYHIRSGAHDVTEFDWKAYLDFADQHWGKP